MLETIGSDASLRYAPAEDLALALARVQADAVLQEAVAQSDWTRLSRQFGGAVEPTPTPTPTQQPHHPTEPDDEDEVAVRVSGVRG